MPPKARNDGEERLCFAHVKEVMPEGSPYDVLVVASDGSLDRQDEIIDPAGWDLANFHRNPVILAAHMHRLSDGRSPVVGHAPLAEVRDGQLLIGIKFADTGLGSEYHSLYSGSHMRAVSVGFMPTAGEWREDGAGGAKGRVWIHTRQELWETSCVAVGANPNALARMRAAAAKMGAAAPALDEKTLDVLAAKVADHLAPALGDQLKTLLAEPLDKLGANIADSKYEILACLPDPIGLDASAAPGPAADGTDRSAGAGETRADPSGRASAARLLAACRSADARNG